MPLQSTNSVLLQRQQLCNILRGDARSVEDELKNTGDDLLPGRLDKER